MCQSINSNLLSLGLLRRTVLMGLLDPNAPDEILDDDRSINEAPPDTYGDGEPEQFVGRDWDRPAGQEWSPLPVALTTTKCHPE